MNSINNTRGGGKFNSLLELKRQIKNEQKWYNVKFSDRIIGTKSYWIAKYLYELRMSEYYWYSDKKDILSRFLGLYHRIKCLRLQNKTGILIGPNSTDFGIHVYYMGTIIVNRLAHIGKNCVLYPGVIIGSLGNGDEQKAPTIGDNVCIFGGVKILGGITIGDNVNIGMNSVIMKDVPSNCNVVGNPACIIRLNGKRVNIPLSEYNSKNE